jgi:hypothetical protein
MRRNMLLTVVVASLVGFVPRASAQTLVTAFPGTPAIAGVSVPLAFPTSADSSEHGPFPNRRQIGVLLGPPKQSTPGRRGSPPVTYAIQSNKSVCRGIKGLFAKLIPFHF